MNYCKVCKTLGKPDATTCPKCGSPLATFGANPAGTTRNAAEPWAPADPGAATPMFHLQGEVRRLEALQRGNLRRGRYFSLISFGALIAILGTLYLVYERTVLCYAVLEDISIRQDPSFDWQIHVSYRIVAPGRVAFSRRSGTHHTEKVDTIGTTGVDGFAWAWPSDPTTGIDFQVVSRGGWLLDSEQKHFDVKTLSPDED